MIKLIIKFIPETQRFTFCKVSKTWNKVIWSMAIRDGIRHSIPKSLEWDLSIAYKIIYSLSLPRPNRSSTYLVNTKEGADNSFLKAYLYRFQKITTQKSKSTEKVLKIFKSSQNLVEIYKYFNYQFQESPESVPLHLLFDVISLKCFLILKRFENISHFMNIFIAIFNQKGSEWISNSLFAPVSDSELELMYKNLKNLNFTWSNLICSIHVHFAEICNLWGISTRFYRSC